MLCRLELALASASYLLDREKIDFRVWRILVLSKYSAHCGHPSTVDHSAFRISTMATSAAEPIGTPIEALFRPSTPFHDRIRERPDDDDESDELLEDFTEVELLPHLTLQDILAAGITWKDLWDCLGDNQIVWTAPDVYVGYMGLPYCLPYIYEHLDDLGVLLAFGDDANGRKQERSACPCNGRYGCCSGDSDLRPSDYPLRNHRRQRRFDTGT
jgi:hypothetical protein